MCPVSFALGRWRGERGRALAIVLASTICRASYEAGFDAGRASKRKAGPRR